MPSTEKFDQLRLRCLWPKSPVDISVIIPLIRRRGIGLRALDSWTSRQTFPRERFEIVALTDGSDPELDRVAHDSLASHDMLFRLERAKETMMWDFGARRATGRVLLFTEGHCEADPSCVQEVVAAIAGGLDAVCCASIGDCPTSAGRLEDRVFVESLQIWARESDPKMVSMRGFAIARHDYLAVGGLHLADSECFAERRLAARLAERGIRFGLAPKAVVRHRPNLTFADLKRESDAFFECEFACRASALEGSHLAFSAVWDQRGSYDRGLARTAMRAALSRPVARFRDLAILAARAVAGPRGDIASNAVALQWTRLRLVLGPPFDRAVQRDFKRHWNRLAHSSSLRALARLPHSGAPLRLNGQLSVADLPGDRMLGFYPLERDAEGKSFRWTQPVFALRLPIPGGSSYELTLKTLSLSRPAGRPSIVIDGRRLPPDRVVRTDDAIVVQLDPLSESPDEDRIIGVATAQLPPTTADARRLGIPLRSISLQPICAMFAQ